MVMEKIKKLRVQLKEVIGKDKIHTAPLSSYICGKHLKM